MSDQSENDCSTTDLKRVMGPGLLLLLLFIVGDILGAGVYAVTGRLAGQVGGVAWLPFLRAPTFVPVLGAVACLYLLGPWARLEADMIQYKIAAGMLAVGVVLWLITYAANRAEGRRNALEDPAELVDD